MKHLLAFVSLVALLCAGCGDDKTYDNPFDVDNDGDGLVAAYDCNDNDEAVGKCAMGDYCKFDSQCGSSVCNSGVCTCTNPNFTGANCEECTNPRMALPGCVKCKPKYVGEQCELCVDTKFTGKDCADCEEHYYPQGSCIRYCHPEFTAHWSQFCPANWSLHWVQSGNAALALVQS